MLTFFNSEEGYIEPIIDNEVGENRITGFTYTYQYKDHLGNIRLSYQDIDGDGQIEPSTEIKEENHYYPFGLKHKGYNNQIIGRDHQYGFGGKEENDELGLEWHDFSARNYDVAIGRWMNIDPLANDYVRYSPYSYTINNPILYIDPDGMRIDFGSLFKRKENESDEDYQKRFMTGINTIMDLSEQSGLSLSIKNTEDGAFLEYATKDGEAIVNGGSETLRTDLMNAIDNKSWTLKVKSTDKASRGSGITVRLNGDQIKGNIEGTRGMDRRTMGFGMTFMHELNHTILGHNSMMKTSSDGSFLNGASEHTVIERINKMREELNAQGGNYGRRSGHAFYPVTAGDGSTKYVLPFDSNSSGSATVDKVVPTAKNAKYIISDTKPKQ